MNTSIFANNFFSMKRGAKFKDCNTTESKKSKELDQYYTKPSVAEKCIQFLEEQLTHSLQKFETILEPSYGDGAFIKCLSSRNIDSHRLLYVDIAAKDEMRKKDFLSNDFSLEPNNGTLTVGNPPFGKNASLAVAFFNKSALFSNVIAFIVPRTFRKPSCFNRLNRNFFLAGETVLGKSSFLFEGQEYDVPCVFQIWSHFNYKMHFKNSDFCKDTLRPLHESLTCTEDFTFCNTGFGADIAIRRVGVNAGRIFTEEVEEKSAQSHLFLSISDRSTKEVVVNDLIALRLEQAEFKYNTAGNPCISKDDLCRAYNDYTIR